MAAPNLKNYHPRETHFFNTANASRTSLQSSKVPWRRIPTFQTQMVMVGRETVTHFTLNGCFSPQHLPNQCPKLVPTEDDSDFLKAIASFPVRIEYDGTKRMHKSMLHHLNEWYSAYINATFPRAIVRYEDLIFHPQKVTEAVCLCAGGAMVGGISKRRSKKLRRKSMPADREGKQQKTNDDGFQFVKESAKDNSSIHGKHKSGLLEAMIQYSRASPNHNMTKADLRFAMDELNPIFMKTFGYKYIITP